MGHIRIKTEGRSKRTSSHSLQHTETHHPLLTIRYSAALSPVPEKVKNWLNFHRPEHHNKPICRLGFRLQRVGWPSLILKRWSAIRKPKFLPKPPVT